MKNSVYWVTFTDGVKVLAANLYHSWTSCHNCYSCLQSPRDNCSYSKNIYYFKNISFNSQDEVDPIFIESIEPAGDMAEVLYGNN